MSRLPVLTIAFALTLPLVACASSSDEAGTSTGALSGDPGSALDEAAAEQEREFENKKVQLRPALLSAYRKASTNEVAEMPLRGLCSNNAQARSFAWAIPESEVVVRSLEDIGALSGVTIEQRPSAENPANADLTFLSPSLGMICTQQKINPRTVLMTCTNVAKDAGPSPEQCGIAR
jgi:hypothetical protein